MPDGSHHRDPLRQARGSLHPRGRRIRPSEKDSGRTVHVYLGSTALALQIRGFWRGVIFYIT